MASESSEGRPVSVDLPPSLDEWLSDRAEATGVDREQLLVDLLGAYRGATEAAGGADALQPLVDDRVDDVRVDFEEKLGDVRARVVQLKRETDRKAGTDRLEALASTVEELEGALSGVRKRVSELDEEVTAVESDVERLSADIDDRGTEVAALSEELAALRDDLRTRAETTDAVDERLADLESKLTRVARVVVALRDEHEEGDGDGGEDSGTATGKSAEGDDGTAGDSRSVAGVRGEGLADIRRAAAREGARSADCGACGESVDVALLPEAACPHCGVEFDGLEGEAGVFRSPTLVGPNAATTTETDDE